MKNTIFLRSTKIVATLGPSSNTENKIKKLIFAGVNVFRLNFSHGSHEDHLSTINVIRRIETNLKLGFSKFAQEPVVKSASLVPIAIAVSVSLLKLFAARPPKPPIVPK